MLAAAYLAATRAQEAEKGIYSWHDNGDGLIALTSNGIRRLLAALVLTPLACLAGKIRSSTWRRRRLHQARASHHGRRGHRRPRS